MGGLHLNQEILGILFLIFFVILIIRILNLIRKNIICLMSETVSNR